MAHEVIMPALGMTQDTGIIVAWHKQPGDAVGASDILAEIETDKATMEIEVGFDGILASVRAEVGIPVPVGEVIAVIAATQEEAGKIAQEQPTAEPPEEIAPTAVAASREPELVASDIPVPVPPAAAAAPARQSISAKGRVLASPKARRLARERGIDLRKLVAQGATQPFHAADLDSIFNGNRTTTEYRSLASPALRQMARERGVDIEALAAELGQQVVSEADIERKANGAVQPFERQYWDVDHSLYGPVEAVAVSRFSQVAAANLTAAQRHIPAVTHHDRADISKLEAFRQSLRDEAAGRGIKLTATAFHVKALAHAMQAFPGFNAALSADGQTLWLKQYVDIAVAVDTPHGLMVPVIRAADGMGLWQIASAIAELSARARDRKIRPEDMGGAGMTITNLGGIGGRGFTPIVNPPEVAILGLTRASMEPVWDGESFVATLMCPLDLSYDHRVINGAEAARFVSAYAALLADPKKLLL